MTKRFVNRRELRGYIVGSPLEAIHSSARLDEDCHVEPSAGSAAPLAASADAQGPGRVPLERAPPNRPRRPHSPSPRALVVTWSVKAREPNAESGTAPSIQYQEALSHADQSYSFAPGGVVTVPFKPRPGHSPGRWGRACGSPGRPGQLSH